MFLSEWREFPSVPCLAGKETWWQLASRFCWNRAPLTCFQVCFLPGRAKDLLAPRYSFFWVIPRLIILCSDVSEHCSLHPHRWCNQEILLTPPMKVEVCSETSARKIQTPGNHPKERQQHSKHGEYLKSRIKSYPYFISSSDLDKIRNRNYP